MDALGILVGYACVAHAGWLIAAAAAHSLGYSEAIGGFSGMMTFVFIIGLLLRCEAAIKSGVRSK